MEKLAGKKEVVTPAIFKLAPFETLKLPPVTDVPRLHVKVERSRVPAVTSILPSADVVELSEGRLPANVFTKEPLIFKVEYVMEFETV